MMIPNAYLVRIRSINGIPEAFGTSLPVPRLSFFCRGMITIGIRTNHSPRLRPHNVIKHLWTKLGIVHQLHHRQLFMLRLTSDLIDCIRIGQWLRIDISICDQYFFAWQAYQAFDVIDRRVARIFKYNDIPAFRIIKHVRIFIDQNPIASKCILRWLIGFIKYFSKATHWTNGRYDFVIRIRVSWIRILYTGPNTIPMTTSLAYVLYMPTL